MLNTPSPQDYLESELLALMVAEDYSLAEKSFSHFIRAAWDVLEPGTPYIHGWHVDLVAEYLEAVQLGQIKKLIINMRFRSIKSIAATVCFPVWWWVKDPTRRFICASFSGELAVGHNVKRRDLIKSPWFQMAWGDRFTLEGDDRKQLFSNDKMGEMFATSVGGTVTGKGADVLIQDDPIDPKQADSEALTARATTWYDKTFSNRKNQESSAEILVMQRLSDKDMTAHVLKKQGWTHLNVPWEAEKKTIVDFPRTKRVMVREPGHLMDPERFSSAMKLEWQKNLGPYGYAAQVQQDPKPLGGGFIKRKWWRRYSVLPKDIKRVRQYWDCAEEPGVDNDFSTCATIAETPTGFYWLHVWREQVAWPELEQAAKDLYALWQSRTGGMVDKVKIEKKSAGTQLFQQLSKFTSIPVEVFEPGQRSKVVRASAAVPSISAGNCYLPESDIGGHLTNSVDWIEDFITEHEKFPHGDHDDQVDTTSMAIEDLRMGDDEVRVWSV